MAVRIGIDIGSSTTKIVAFEGEHMLPPMAVKADSQVASLCLLYTSDAADE